MKLTFVIPTFNRPKELRVCVRSIAEQISDDEVEILILDNGSEEDTGIAIGRLQSEYGFIRTEQFETNIGYAESFHRMFISSHNSDWVWTFGDDDYLMPNALQFMLEQLDRFEEGDVSFIHVAEVQRASGTNGCYRGTLFDLCCKFGWIDMTGFVSGNIVRGKCLWQAGQTRNWDEYARTSFVHSCALLEELRCEPAVLLDLPLINTQNVQQTEESLQRWVQENIPGRYLNLTDALEIMVKDHQIPPKLPTSFFRYLTQNLWDRYLAHFIDNYGQHGSQHTDEAWIHIRKFARFLEDEEVANKLLSDIDAARGMITLHSYMKMNLEGIFQEILDLGTRRQQQSYPWNFVSLPEPEGNPSPE